MSENPVFDRIKNEVSSEDVVLFMKGQFQLDSFP